MRPEVLVLFKKKDANMIRIKTLEHWSYISNKKLTLQIIILFNTVNQPRAPSQVECAAVNVIFITLIEKD